MNRVWKYKLIVYDEHLGDEYPAEGVIFAKSYADAAGKLDGAYSFIDFNGEYGTYICNMTIEEYLDNGGDPTEIYEIKGVKDYECNLP